MKQLTVIFTLLVLLSGVTLQAQTITDEQTQPPSLLMLVLLDDTLTNIQRGDNSATSASTQYRQAPVQREATDPRDGRGQAVSRMLTYLQADATTTHEVGVLRFATLSEAPQWLTGDDTSPFVLLGGDDSTRDSYTRSVESILTRDDYDVVGPGDTALALETALDTFISEVEAARDRPVKPVIVLMTDDVPIEAWNPQDSPWLSANPSGWQTYIERFEAPLRNLASVSSYEGYCAAEAGITMSVFAMGAANWVNEDGSIAYDTIGNVITADGQSPGQGDYFVSLLNDLNSINPRTGDPYIYPLDPAFEDATGVTLENNIQAQAESFMRDVRCLYPLAVTSSDTLSRTTYTFQPSTMMEQITLLLEAQDETVINPALTLPDGSPVDAVQIAERENVVALRVSHADFPATWRGEWTLSVERGALRDITAAAALDYSGLTAEPQSPPESLVQGEDFRYTVALRDRYGQPVGEDALVEALQLQVGDNEPFASMTYDPGSDAYTRTVSGAVVQSEGTYDISARLQFADLPAGIPLPFDAQIFSFDPLSTESQLNLGRPPAIGRLACINGTAELTIPIRFDDDSNPDSIASYMRVEAFYESTDSPLSVLGWDFEGGFTGTIDCSALDAGDSQTFTVVGTLPDGNTQERTISFSFEPTPTPTLRPSPTPNPLPTPTPAPPVPNYTDNVVNSINSFPLNYLLLIGAGLLGLRLIWLLVAAFRRNLIPLHNVYVETRLATEEKPREPLLSGIRRYLPFQNRIFYLADDTATQPPATGDEDDTTDAPPEIRLFRVAGRYGGRTLKITVFAHNVRVNGIHLPLNTPREIGGKEVTVTFETGTGDVQVYRLINYYGR